MKTLLALLLAVLSLSSIGCTAVKHKLDSLSDDELAMYVEEGAQVTAKYGLSLAAKKWPNEADKIKADAIVIDNALRTIAIPAFSGASTAQVTKATLDQVIRQLGDRIKGTKLEQYEMAFASILYQIPLPATVTEGLSERTLKSLAAFFTGIAEGIEKAEGLPGPVPTPVPAPTLAPVPPVKNP